MFYNTNLPPHLRTLKDEIEGYARDYGLDFFETIFEVIDADDLNEIAAYGGFPTRYPHWSFGMQYEELSKGYDYGLSKIYEMVINNDPCYAYLMRCNHMVDQKLVMAHVYGHCDFFKNNAYFAHTNRKMMDEIANHAARIRDYAERFGEDEVEAFMDRCMSLDDLIDIHSTAIKRRDDHSKYDFEEKEEEPEERRFKSKDYMDQYINPRRKRADDDDGKPKKQPPLNFPDHPEKDILLFLIEHAPLKNWQRDMLSIVRDEAYYFMPQGQTKIINEGWACLVPGSLVLTDKGLLPIERIAGGRMTVGVSDGDSGRRVVDWASFEERETVRVRTRRGLELEGSLTHRLMRPDGSWVALGEVRAGDSIKVARGQRLWASSMVRLEWAPKQRTTLEKVAENAGVSIWTVLRNRAGKRIEKVEAVAAGLVGYEREYEELSFNQNNRAEIRIPKLVDEEFASFLGYLAGAGHISDVKRVIGLTTGDLEQAERFAEQVRNLFAMEPRLKKEGNKYRVLFSSRTVQDFLVHLGLPTGVAARRKSVPDCILRSPEPVVAAFLRSLYDCDGYAGPMGVILSTSSDRMAEQVLILLLNFGILSRRRMQKDGCWHVHSIGQSAKAFGERIGFGLDRKAKRLREYVESKQWFKAESEADEIVSIERGRSQVFDVTVEATHRYVAQGFVNHNSFWHSTIMTQKVLQPSEVIDYADHHSGTMAMSGGRLNPYKLGIELLRDVEMRWNTGKFGPEYDDCDDLDTKRKWDKQLGLGRQKIFEARKVHNDITFIDTYLTPEFCARHNLFSFGYNDSAEQYLIESREFPKIKERLLFSLTNFGRPWIVVMNGNHRNRGELLLKHMHNGLDLKEDPAKDTLANIQYLWNRPVHIETVIEGKPALLSFDGTDHTVQLIGETDAKRSGDSKAK